MRKHNKILSCTRTPFGAWKMIVQTPNEKIHVRSYFGYSKREAIHKVRVTDFDKEAGLVFNQSPPPTKKRGGGRER